MSTSNHGPPIPFTPSLEPAPPHLSTPTSPAPTLSEILETLLNFSHSYATALATEERRHKRYPPNPAHAQRLAFSKGLYFAAWEIRVVREVLEDLEAYCMAAEKRRVEIKDGTRDGSEVWSDGAAGRYFRRGLDRSQRSEACLGHPRSMGSFCDCDDIREEDVALEKAIQESEQRRREIEKRLELVRREIEKQVTIRETIGHRLGEERRLQNERRIEGLVETRGELLEELERCDDYPGHDVEKFERIRAEMEGRRRETVERRVRERGGGGAGQVFVEQDAQFAREKVKDVLRDQNIAQHGPSSGDELPGLQLARNGTELPGDLPQAEHDQAHHRLTTNPQSLPLHPYHRIHTLGDPKQPKPIPSIYIQARIPAGYTIPYPHPTPYISTFATSATIFIFPTPTTPSQCLNLIQSLTRRALHIDAIYRPHDQAVLKRAIELDCHIRVWYSTAGLLPERSLWDEDGGDLYVVPDGEPGVEGENGTAGQRGENRRRGSGHGQAFLMRGGQDAEEEDVKEDGTAQEQTYSWTNPYDLTGTSIICPYDGSSGPGNVEPDQGQHGDHTLQWPGTESLASPDTDQETADLHSELQALRDENQELRSAISQMHESVLRGMHDILDQNEHSASTPNPQVIPRRRSSSAFKNWTGYTPTSTSKHPQPPTFDTFLFFPSVSTLVALSKPREYFSWEHPTILPRIRELLHARKQTRTEDNAFLARIQEILCERDASGLRDPNTSDGKVVVISAPDVVARAGQHGYGERIIALQTKDRVVEKATDSSSEALSLIERLRLQKHASEIGTGDESEGDSEDERRFRNIKQIVDALDGDPSSEDDGVVTPRGHPIGGRLSSSRLANMIRETEGHAREAARGYTALCWWRGGGTVAEGEGMGKREYEMPPDMVPEMFPTASTERIAKPRERDDSEPPYTPCRDILTGTEPLSHMNLPVPPPYPRLPHTSPSPTPSIPSRSSSLTSSMIQNLSRMSASYPFKVCTNPCAVPALCTNATIKPTMSRIFDSPLEGEVRRGMEKGEGGELSRLEAFEERLREAMRVFRGDGVGVRGREDEGDGGSAGLECVARPSTPEGLGGGRGLEGRLRKGKQPNVEDARSEEEE